jgi:hypothetical protein
MYVLYIYIYSIKPVRRISEKDDWTIQSPVSEFYDDGDRLSGPITTEFHEQQNYQCRTVDIISGLR